MQDDIKELEQINGDTENRLSDEIKLNISKLED